MSGSPQRTDVLIKRLHRAANGLRRLAGGVTPSDEIVQFQAWANTCDQAAGRLDDLLTQYRAAKRARQSEPTADAVQL